MTTTRFVVKLQHKHLNSNYLYRIVRETVYDNGTVREEETVDQATTLDDAIRVAEKFSGALE